MAFVNVYFSLGSNLGDREKNITEALSLMDAAFDSHYTALSRIVETKPMGFTGGKFLNAVVLYRIFRPETSLEEAAMDVLDKVKNIEVALGRTDKPEYDAAGERVYHSRTIDIDILFYGSERLETPKLTIPHLGILERQFVMFPLVEIAKPSLKEAFPEYFQ